MEKSKFQIVFKLILVFCLSIILFIATLMSSKHTIYTTEDLKHVELGFPLKYLVQDQSGSEPPLPINTGLSSPLEHPIKINWMKLILSFLIVFICTFVLFDLMMWI